MSKRREESRRKISHAAARVLREVGVMGFTTDLVAARAECAKGLVHYHFRTKTDLLRDVVTRAAEARVRRWRRAFRAASPQDAIASTWQLVLDEQATGTLHLAGGLMACATELDETLRELDSAFADALSESARQMLSNAGLGLSVAEAQIGWLLSATVNGAAGLLARGADPTAVEDAYAAAWLGILSLAE